MNFLCFDIGGTELKTGILSENAEILSFQREQSPGDEREFPSFLGSAARRIMDAGDIEFSGICVSSRGIIDTIEGEIIRDREEPRIRIAAPLREAVGLSVEVENDVNCVAMAEHWLGAAKGFSDVVCVTVGTGIGGAFINGNRLYRGKGFNAMEVGNMPFSGAGESWEAMASVKAMISEYAVRGGHNQGEVNGEIIVELVKKRDAMALDVFENFCRRLALGISSLICVLAPEVVVVGGGISAAGDIILHRLNAHVEKILPQRLRGNTVLKCAKLGNKAGVVGAFKHFWEMRKFRKNEGEHNG